MLELLFLTLSTRGSRLTEIKSPIQRHCMDINAMKWEFGLGRVGDSWQSKAWRHRGDNVPRNRLQGRDICYRALPMGEQQPPASPIPGDELQLQGWGQNSSRNFPGCLQIPPKCSQSLGRCSLKQLGALSGRSGAAAEGVLSTMLSLNS